MKWLDRLRDAWKNDPYERLVDAAIEADDEDFLLRLYSGMVDDDEINERVAALDNNA